MSRWFVVAAVVAFALLTSAVGLAAGDGGRRSDSIRIAGDEARAIVVASAELARRIAIGAEKRCRQRVENNFVTLYGDATSVGVLFYSNGKCEGPDAVVKDHGLLCIIQRTDGKVEQCYRDLEINNGLRRYTGDE